MKKIGLVLEILKLLSRFGERALTTTEVFELLVSKGVLDNSPADRKRLVRALTDMEIWGYLESCNQSQRGRVPQSWRINVKAFPYLISLSEEEILSLLILTAFVPDFYKEFEVVKPAFNIIDRLGRTVPEDTKEVAKESFDYLPIPIFRCASPKDGDLRLLFKGIVNRNPVVILYKGKQFTVYPIKVFTYNGNFYLSAVNSDTKVYYSFHFDKLKVLELLPEKYPLYYWKRYKDSYFAFEEKPFLYKVKLPADYYDGVGEISKVKIYYTQYHVEKEENAISVYLVGFTGYRYASWLALDEVLGYFPPDKSLIEKAKEMNLKKRYPGLSYSVEENERRYREFCKNLKKFFFRRLKVIEEL